MVAFKCVVGCIASASNLTKQLCNFTRNDSTILKAAQQVVLGFFWCDKLASFRRDKLCQQLGKLTQLEQTGIGIVCEILFCQHAQTQQLFVVLL